MPLYELGLVLTTDLDAEEREAFIGEVKGLLTGGGATFVKEDVWGKRMLAYEIRHKREGYYMFWQFDAPGTVIKPLEYRLRLSDPVLRFLTLNLDVEMRRKKKFDRKRAEKKAESARKAAEKAPAAEQEA